MRTERVEIRCDRCGELMEDSRTIEIKSAYGAPFAIERLTDTWRHIDLCPKCRDSFIDWWRESKNE